MTFCTVNCNALASRNAMLAAIPFLLLLPLSSSSGSGSKAKRDND